MSQTVIEQIKMAAEIEDVEDDAMTVERAIAAGREHAAAGKKLTPFDCQEFDKKIFALTRGKERLEAVKIYNTLRGAFNKGWNEKYFEMVTAV